MPPSRPQLVQRPRKCDRLANVRDATDPRDRALHAQPKARVDERPVLAEIQVPAVRLLGKLLLADAREQPAVVVLALAAPDDLAVPLRRQHVVVEHGARVGGVFLHIEGLHGLGVVVDHHGTIVLFGEQRLGVSPQVAAPFDVAPQRLELFHRVGVGNPGKRRPDALERSRVPLEIDQLRALPLERARHDVGDELLLKLHIVVGVVPGDFGLDHPELGKMTARLGLLGAERGPEAVHLAVCRRRGFDVQLAGLGQIRRAQVEVLSREQVPGGFADRAREDRRVDQHKVALVEEVADRLDHFLADRSGLDRAAAAQPQVPVLEQEGGAVLLGRDREILARPEDRHVGGRELDTPRRPRVGAHQPRHLDGRLLREPAERLPGGVGDILLGEDHLQVTRAVAQHHERDLAARARGHHPAAHEDRAAPEARQRLDTMKVGHRRGILVAGFWAVNATACATPYVPPSRLGPQRQEASWPVYLGTPRHDACIAESVNADPRPLWHTSVGRAVRGSPALGETVIVVGVADRVVTLVDRALAGGGARAAPIPVGDGIVVATTADTLYLLERASGQVRTRLHTPGTMIAAPALDGARLYAATTAGRMLAIDFPALTVAWDLPAGDAVLGAPAVAHDTVYALARNGTLWLVPKDRPSEARSFALGITATAGPTPVASGVLVASVSGEVLLVDRRAGTILWRIELDGPIEQPPLVRDRQLVIVAGRGDIQAYR